MKRLALLLLVLAGCGNDPPQCGGAFRTIFRWENGPSQPYLLRDQGALKPLCCRDGVCTFAEDPPHG